MSSQSGHVYVWSVLVHYFSTRFANLRNAIPYITHSSPQLLYHVMCTYYVYQTRHVSLLEVNEGYLQAAVKLGEPGSGSWALLWPHGLSKELLLQQRAAYQSVDNVWEPPHLLLVYSSQICFCKQGDKYGRITQYHPLSKETSSIACLLHRIALALAGPRLKRLKMGQVPLYLVSDQS